MHTDKLYCPKLQNPKIIVFTYKTFTISTRELQNVTNEYPKCKQTAADVNKQLFLHYLCNLSYKTFTISTRELQNIIKDYPRCKQAAIDVKILIVKFCLLYSKKGGVPKSGTTYKSEGKIREVDLFQYFTKFS